MNAEFEKFVLERQSTEHELMYGLKPEDWEWQLAAVAYLAGAAAMREKAARECRDAVYKLYTDWQKGNNYYTAEYAEAISDALRVIDKLEG